MPLYPVGTILMDRGDLGMIIRYDAKAWMCPYIIEFTSGFKLAFEESEVREFIYQLEDYMVNHYGDNDEATT